MNIMMLSLDGQGYGDFHFLVYLYMLSFLPLLKERACITFIIGIKLFPLGGESGGQIKYLGPLSGIHSKNKNTMLTLISYQVPGPVSM